MKKFLLSILTIVYMGVSAGIAMDIHFCMGKRVAVDFYKSADGKCSKCGMTEKNNGCCHDEIQFHKLEDSHKHVLNELHFENAAPEILPVNPQYVWRYTSLEDKVLQFVYPPPLISGPSTCIMHCIFRL